MHILHDLHDDELINTLRQGGVAVLRTDTLYGVIARANDQSAVERVYEMKGRDGDKSPIVLIASAQQIYDELSDEQSKLLNTVWPGKVSVILPSKNAPEWISRGNQSVAYRLPADESLRAVIEKTGPLIAPSANPQGETPAMSIEQAMNYFRDQVDVYIDGGVVGDASPSQLIRLNDDGTVERLR